MSLMTMQFIIVCSILQTVLGTLDFYQAVDEDDERNTVGQGIRSIFQTSLGVIVFITMMSLM